MRLHRSPHRWHTFIRSEFGCIARQRRALREPRFRPHWCGAQGAGSRCTATATRATARAGHAAGSDAATGAPSSSVPLIDPPHSACRAHRRCRAQQLGRSPRPHPIDAPGENRAVNRYLKTLNEWARFAGPCCVRALARRDSVGAKTTASRCSGVYGGVALLAFLHARAADRSWKSGGRRTRCP